MPTDLAHKPELVGRRVRLRPFSEADIAAMGPILAEPEVIRLTGSANSSAEAAAVAPELDERTLAWYRSRAQQTDRLDLAIVDLADDRCVGEVVLNQWSPADQSCNLRILVGAAGQGRGLGSEAVRLVLEYAFAGLDLYRVELGVLDFNPRARHVYERTGFVLEGRRRGALRYDGERVDELVMAVLQPEWTAAQAGGAR